MGPLARRGGDGRGEERRVEKPQKRGYDRGTNTQPRNRPDLIRSLLCLRKEQLVQVSMPRESVFFIGEKKVNKSNSFPGTKNFKL